MTPEKFESKFTLSVVQTMKVLFFFFATLAEILNFVNYEFLTKHISMLFY